MADQIGFLALRITFAGVYLYAAYQNTKFFSSYTIPETALLFRGMAIAKNEGFVKIASILGLITMYVGATGIALGVLGRICAFALAAFTLMGIVIHRHRWKDAQQSANDENNPDPAMAWSAYSGHFSSALKNWALVGICIFIALVGTGPLSLFQW